MTRSGPKVLSSCSSHPPHSSSTHSSSTHPAHSSSTSSSTHLPHSQPHHLSTSGSQHHSRGHPLCSQGRQCGPPSHPIGWTPRCSPLSPSWQHCSLWYHLWCFLLSPHRLPPPQPALLPPHRHHRFWTSVWDSLLPSTSFLCAMGGDGDKSADNNNNSKRGDVWRVPKFHGQCLPWTVSKDII